MKRVIGFVNDVKRGPAAELFGDNSDERQLREFIFAALQECAGFIEAQVA